MLQIVFETYFLPIALIFIALGVYAFGWLYIHVEHARHVSWQRIVAAGLLGSVLCGFGIHFLLEFLGM